MQVPPNAKQTAIKIEKREPTRPRVDTSLFADHFNKNKLPELEGFVEQMVSRINAQKEGEEPLCCELCGQKVSPRIAKIDADIVVCVLVLYYIADLRKSLPVMTAADIAQVLTTVFKGSERIDPAMVEIWMKYAFAMGAASRTHPSEDSPLMSYSIFDTGRDFVEGVAYPLINYMVYNGEILGHLTTGVEPLGLPFDKILNDQYGEIPIDDNGNKAVAWEFFKTAIYQAVKTFVSINKIQP